MDRSIEAILNLGEALRNNRVNRELIKEVATGLENDISSAINYKEYKFSNELSSVGLEDAKVYLYEAFDLVKDHSYRNNSELTKRLTQALRNLSDRIKSITEKREVNSTLVDKLLHYYNSEAKIKYEISEEEEALNKFTAAEDNRDADIDLYRQSGYLISIIKENEDMSSSKRDALLYDLEHLSTRETNITIRNPFYPFLSFVLNLNKDKLNMEWYMSSIDNVSTNIPAIEVINNIINNIFCGLIDKMADDILSYYTRKYFDVSDLEKTKALVERSEKITEEELVFLKADAALMNVFLQDGKVSGLDIFIFFLEMIYSKEVKR